MSFLKRLFGGMETGIEPATKTAVRRDVDANGLASKLKQATPPYLLDVREPYEYADGHIAGAILIPLGELSRRWGELPRDREIVCVCRSGNRSGAARRQLQQAGYNAINLNGGMVGWQLAGLPIQRGRH